MSALRVAHIYVNIVDSERTHYILQLSYLEAASPGAVTAVPPPYKGTFAHVVDTEVGHLPMPEAHALAVGSSVFTQRSRDWSMRDIWPR